MASAWRMTASLSSDAPALRIGHGTVIVVADRGWTDTSSRLKRDIRLADLHRVALAVYCDTLCPLDGSCTRRAVVEG